MGTVLARPQSFNYLRGHFEKSARLLWPATLLPCLGAESQKMTCMLDLKSTYWSLVGNKGTQSLHSPYTIHSLSLRRTTKSINIAFQLVGAPRDVESETERRLDPRVISL